MYEIYIYTLLTWSFKFRFETAGDAASLAQSLGSASKLEARLAPRVCRNKGFLCYLIIKTSCNLSCLRLTEAILKADDV